MLPLQCVHTVQKKTSKAVSERRCRDTLLPSPIAAADQLKKTLLAKRMKAINDLLVFSER